MILLTVLITNSCQSSSRTSEIAIPELHIDVKRPVLGSIPELDVTGWTDKQVSDVTEVLSAYNTNLGLLTIYVKSLEQAYAVKVEYFNNIIKILAQ